MSIITRDEVKQMRKEIDKQGFHPGPPPGRDYWHVGRIVETLEAAYDGRLNERGTMKPFDDGYDHCIICEKCGFEHPPGNEPWAKYVVGEFDPRGQDNVPIWSNVEEIPEYFIRTCCRCGYKWAESVPEEENPIAEPLEYFGGNPGYPNEFICKRCGYTFGAANLADANRLARDHLKREHGIDH